LVKSDAWFNSTVTKVNWVNGGLFIMAYNGFGLGEGGGFNHKSLIE